MRCESITFYVVLQSLFFFKLHHGAEITPPYHLAENPFFTFFLLRVAFTSYGAFWLSFATLFIPGSGVGDAYKTAAKGMEDDAIGIFLMAWMVLTALFL